MPLLIACRSLSISATSIGKSTPGRGIICRSKASPCRSTMPGNTSRPLASMPGEPWPSSVPTATISRPAIRSEVSTNLLAEQGPAAFDEQFGHDAALWLMADGGCAGRFVFVEKVLDVELAEIGQGAAQRLMVPVPPGELREPAGDRLPETAA